MGLSDRAITSWVRAGRLHRVHRGVFALGHAALSQEGRWMGAVLAAAPGAVLSHRSAAHLWGLFTRSPSLVDVTTTRTKRHVGGVAVHRTRCLDEHEVTRHNGIPVTTVARTLTDLADVAPASVVARALHRAQIAYGVTPSPINGRRGAARLKQPPDASRSELERTFRKLCTDHGLPPPEHNAMVAGIEVDFVWRAEGLVVELDGWAYHRTRHAFEHDRERDQVLAREGLRVLRFTYRQMQSDAAGAARTVRAALASPR